jgi:hypothetical protein
VTTTSGAPPATDGEPRRGRRWRSWGWRRRLVVIAGVVVALLVVGRLVLDPIATRYTRGKLAGLSGYKGTFDRLHVSVIPPRIDITRLKVVESPEGKWKEPLFYADHQRTSILWRRLLDGMLVARTRINGMKVVLVRQHEKKAKKELPGVGLQLENLSPLKMDRLEIHDGELLFAERPSKDAPRLWVHRIEATVANLVTRKALARGRPITAEVRAVIQRSGKVRGSLTADPFAVGPTFSGKVALDGLDLRDLHGFLAEKSDLQAVRGELEAFADFRVRNGKLEGGVKPVLRNLEIRAAGNNVFDRMKAWFVDKAVDIAEDDVPGRHAVATVIPLRGKLSNPEAQLWPAALGVVRNAFVVALESGFARLPPREASRKEGVLEQAVEALKKDEGPPEAQPTPGEEKAKKAASEANQRQARSPRRR